MTTCLCSGPFTIAAICLLVVLRNGLRSFAFISLDGLSAPDVVVLPLPPPLVLMLLFVVIAFFTPFVSPASPSRACCLAGRTKKLLQRDAGKKATVQFLEGKCYNIWLFRKLRAMASRLGFGLLQRKPAVAHGEAVTKKKKSPSEILLVGCRPLKKGKRVCVAGKDHCSRDRT